MAKNQAETDRRILSCLQRDARVSNLRLASHVGMSAGSCARRVRALERDGVIRRYVALVDPKAVGFGVTVFVELSLNLQREALLEAFEEAIIGRPDVLECYLMTGDADYMLRVVTTDVQGYERFLKTSLTRIDGVARIKSSFALKRLKYSTALPLDSVAVAPRPSADPHPPPPATLDEIDVRILNALQHEARLSNVDLAERVGLTPAPCLRRVRALEHAHVIRRYAALVDPSAVQLGVTVFVRITLVQQVEKRLETFEAAIRRHPEVMECYLMTGDADYLLRVVVPDVDAYERFLETALTRTAGVASIKSSFALRQGQVLNGAPTPVVSGPERQTRLLNQFYNHLVSTDTPHDHYDAQRAARLASEAAQATADRRLGTVRLLVVGVTLALAWAAFWQSWISGWWLLAPGAVFAVLIRAHDRVIRKRETAGRAVQWYERGLARLEHRWAGKGEAGVRFLDDDHPYARDLDLFGSGSLFQLMNTCQTTTGEETLAGWLLEAAGPDTVRARQAAVVDMSNRPQLREDLFTWGVDARQSVDSSALNTWAQAPPRLPIRSLRLAGPALAAAAIASVVAWIVGAVSGAVPLVVLLFNALVGPLGRPPGWTGAPWYVGACARADGTRAGVGTSAGRCVRRR